MSEIRDYLQSLMRLMANPLSEFMLAHGEVYPTGPHSFDLPRAEPKQCYSNATHLALNRPFMTYVEGMVSLEGLPIHHAWCIDETGTVVEPTFRPATADGTMLRVREYFGVTFRTDYVQRAILVNDCYGLLDGYYAQRTLPKLVELGLEAGQQWLLDRRVRRRGRKLLLATVAALALLLPQVHAAQVTTYGADGREVWSETTGRNGSGTLYGPDGRVRERSTTGRDGTVTTYDNGTGRVILRAVPMERRP